ncbi:MAG: hypothetical protein NVSMB46_05950 [Candidatus Saccharimonadales bacterium]
MVHDMSFSVDHVEMFRNSVDSIGYYETTTVYIPSVTPSYRMFYRTFVNTYVTTTNGVQAGIA